MANKNKPEIYVCAGCSVVILPAPGLCAACKEFFGKPKPAKPSK